MVHPKKSDNRALFVCDACGFAYNDEKTAAACEAYCTVHNACSLEITREAVKRV